MFQEYNFLKQFWNMKHVFSSSIQINCLNLKD